MIKKIKLVHHARCSSKKISDNCTIKQVNYKSPMGLDTAGFTYDCDTAGGSSGGAILDKNGSLIGIHHMGYLKNKNGDCDNENKGIKIEEIKIHLKGLKKLNNASKE